MVTLVILGWDKMTEEEKSMDTRDISAPIGWIRENQVLHKLFPEEFWNKPFPDFFTYDFKANYKRLATIGAEYLKSVFLDEDFLGDISESQKEQLAAGEAFVRHLGAKLEDPRSSPDYFLGGIVWFSSLVRFFRLGMQKQEKGLHPMVSISW